MEYVQMSNGNNYFSYIQILTLSSIEERNAYRILVGKLEGTRPLGRPRRKLVDNIKMDLSEIG
jgi:hypothetical protein